MSDKKIISIKKAAKILGVDIQTLRRWDATGKLKPDFTSPGGHRRYNQEVIEALSSNLFVLAKKWVESDRTTQLPNTLLCENSAVFQLRLTKLQNDLEKIPELNVLFPLIVAITGEIGNNSFDHNLGNWPDIMGIFFSYDLRKKQIVLADRGQGILTTLKRIRPTLQSDEEALRVAFTEIISGRAPERRGNGLKFVYAVVKEHPIRLMFQSGSAVIELFENKGLEIKKYNPIHGTLALIEF